MGKHLQCGLSLRVVLYFARNVEEELTPDDVATKFAVPVEQIGYRLSRCLRDGMLAVRRDDRIGRGARVVYFAGPVLLELVGITKTQIEACIANGGPGEVVVG